MNNNAIGIIIAGMILFGNTGYGFAHSLVNSEKVERSNSDFQSREISMEVSAGRGTDIRINNNNRNIEIKTWNNPKVKVVTTLYYEGDASKISDEEWFEKLSLSVKGVGNTVRIKTTTVSGNGSYMMNGQSYNWSSSANNNYGNKKDSKRIIIYVPKENKVDIESIYGDVTVTDNLDKAVIDISNGDLELQDLTSLTLRSKYGNVNAGNIQTGEFEFSNGHLNVKNVQELSLDTKYSTIDIETADKLNMISTNDEYEIEEVGSLQAQKNYGNLRIVKLTKSLDIQGINADVKVRNIASSVETIKFDDKYANLLLPLRSVKSYTINYIGPNSTVYGNFEKKVYTGKAFKTSSFDEKFGSDNGQSGDDAISNSKFSATVGNGKGASIDLKCQNCTVDFK